MENKEKKACKKCEEEKIGERIPLYAFPQPKTV